MVKDSTKKGTRRLYFVAPGTEQQLLPYLMMGYFLLLK